MGIRAFFNKVNETLDRWTQEAEVEYQKKLANASNQFINGFGENFHCSDRQYTRFKRACSPYEIGSMVSLNKAKLCCKFHSSTKHDIIYKTTLVNCSCPDFSVSNQPCKHMYKLALELGIISTDWDISGIPCELRSILDNLYYSDLCQFLQLLAHYPAYELFKISKSDVPESLIESHLVIEAHTPYDYAKILDKHYSKNDIFTALTLAKNSYVPNSSSTKRDMIQWIIDNDEKLLAILRKKHYSVSFSGEVIAYKSYILREYSSFLCE